nr:helix-turn-helix domain-containing protein [Propionicimonas sp.]
MSTLRAAPPAPDPDAPRWLSLREAAAIYGVSLDILRRCMTRGELHAAHLGKRIIRVLPSDLDALFKVVPRRGWQRPATVICFTATTLLVIAGRRLRPPAVDRQRRWLLCHPLPSCLQIVSTCRQ